MGLNPVGVVCVFMFAKPIISIDAIRISNFVDLWVIKIKTLWSFAHAVHWDQVNRARNVDQAARTCERFVYSIVEITRLYDYQTWQTLLLLSLLLLSSLLLLLLWEIHKVHKGMWALFLLCFSDADWLCRQTPILWLSLFIETYQPKMHALHIRFALILLQRHFFGNDCNLKVALFFTWYYFKISFCRNQLSYLWHTQNCMKKWESNLLKESSSMDLLGQVCCWWDQLLSGRGFWYSYTL